jgi:hypothetical protein
MNGHRHLVPVWYGSHGAVGAMPAPHVSRETTSGSPIHCTDASVFAQRPMNGRIAREPGLPAAGHARGPGLPPTRLTREDDLSEGRPGTPGAFGSRPVRWAWRRRAISIRVAAAWSAVPLGLLPGLVLLVLSSA